MPLSDKLGARMRPDWREQAKGVQMTPELARILALPRRQPKWYNGGGYDRESGCAGCKLCENDQPSLFPSQYAALEEAKRVGGLVSMQGVGCGKSLVAALLPTALESKRTIIMVDPALKPQMQSDLKLYGLHFAVRENVIDVVAYSELSSSNGADILDRTQPDLIVADEAHRLRSKQSARTKRFLRYMKAHPKCRFVALSGTLISRSILDYAHFFDLALGDRSPLPGKYGDLHDWAAAIDENPVAFPIAPGKLLLLCDEGEDLRSGYRRRIVETPGVISTPESELGVSLVIHGRTPPPDPVIESALRHLERYWEWDGEEIEDVLAFQRIARQLSLGFHYRWVWPNGSPDLEWLEARAEWHREVRKFLRYNSKPGLDSPGLLERAAEDGVWKPRAWNAWSRVRMRPIPPTQAVWLSKSVVFDTVKWCADVGSGIVFYEHEAFGAEVAGEGRFRLYGGGEEASEDLLRVSEKINPIVVCSQHAHGTGKNLQMYDKMLLVAPPPGALAWEQIVGRIHRPGQKADCVEVTTYAHSKVFKKALTSAEKNGRFLESVNGNKMKIVYANKVNI